MRILHVTPFYEPAWLYGGMARASAGLCRALARQGHEVTVVTALLDPRHPREEEVGGVRVRRFPGPALLQRWLVPWASGLGGFLRRGLGSFDVAHLQGHRNGLALTARAALEGAGIPWVLAPNGTLPHHHQLRLAKLVFDRLAGDRVVSGASVLVALSDAEARDLPRPARVIPNGVEPCGEARAGHPRRPRSQLLFVGTDRFQKRGHHLSAVVAALPEVELHLVGRFGSALLASLRRFGDRVRVSGVLEGPPLADAYASADLLLHPAVGEAFGLVPFEAALAGTASVVAGGHGCGEWFGRAGGCVVPPDDVDALVGAAAARLADVPLREREVRAVAGFARSELTWDRVARAMEGVYRDVIAALPRVRGAA